MPSPAIKAGGLWGLVDLSTLDLAATEDIIRSSCEYRRLQRRSRPGIAPPRHAGPHVLSVDHAKWVMDGHACSIAVSGDDHG